MGAAKRRAQAERSRKNCEPCKIVQEHKDAGFEPSTDLLAVRERPHTCITEEQLRVPVGHTVDEHTILDKKISEAITTMFEMLKRHYPTRNDLMVDLLREGIRVGLEAQAAAKAKLAKEREERLVLLPNEVFAPGTEYVLGKRNPLVVD
jgi:hypothetical protein